MSSEEDKAHKDGEEDKKSLEEEGSDDEIVLPSVKLDKAREDQKKIQDEIKENYEKNKDEIKEIPTLPTPRKMAIRVTLSGHVSKVTSCVFCPEKANAELLLSTAQDGRLLIWNSETALKCWAVRMASSQTMASAWSPCGRFIAAGGLDNTVSIYDWQNEGPERLKPIKELRHHDSYIGGLEFAGSDTILSASGDGKIVQCNLETEESTVFARDHVEDVTCIAVSPKDNNIFVTGSVDKTVRLWDRRKKSSITAFRGHASDINSVCFFPNGDAFGTCGEDGTARLFDIRAGTALFVYTSPDKSAIDSIQFSASGCLTFLGQTNGAILAWDTFHNTLVSRLAPPHTSAVSSLSLRSDGFALASASWDHSLKIWA